MQRTGNETIRTQIQPSKPKREINKITNSQNTKRIYGQPVSSSFLSNPKRTKNIIKTHKVKRHRNSHQNQATENTNRTTALERSVINYWPSGGGGVGGGLKHLLRRQPRPQFLKRYKTCSWLFGSHDTCNMLYGASLVLSF